MSNVSIGIQVGYKANAISPAHGLNGLYHIIHAEHQLTHGGYVTEMVLESPKHTLKPIDAGYRTQNQNN